MGPLDIVSAKWEWETTETTTKVPVWTTPWDINAVLELSQVAQQRKQALEKYPYLKDKVTITNHGIIVQTSAWELKFGFSHTEWGQTFEAAKKPYSKKQLEVLVELFWNEPAPYLSILGLKGTCRDWNKTNNYNFYWSSSENNKNNAWGLYISNSQVNILTNFKISKNSTFSV